MGALGFDVPRKEALEKVTGRTKYNTDITSPDLLCASLVTSLYAHATIRSVDVSAALNTPGVLAVVTGDQTDIMCGPVLGDRPPLARGKVRYCGEPIAIVIAFSEAEAMQGVQAVKVEYEPLPVVNSALDALRPGAPLLHEAMATYKLDAPEIYPEPGTNIGHRTRIRKGDMARGWAEAEVVIEGRYTLPQVDHAAMEPRNAIAEIAPDGRIIIHASSQVPFDITKQISKYFGLKDDGLVRVHTPLVGGAFGGKTTVQLEPLAVLASRAVNGRPVKLFNHREQDIRTSPVGMGLVAHVKIGARRDGTLTAMEITHLMDAGGYMDKAPYIAKAMGQDCTGPYRVDNVWCDVLCVYTNHTFTTSFRGFGHSSLTFPIERTLDKLALALQMDPIELRRKNAIGDGDTSPIQAPVTLSNAGDLPKCISRLQALMRWDEGMRIESGPGKVRAKGISCLWKTSSSPPEVVSGAIMILNYEGSVNLSIGAVEIGQGTKTAMAQIAAERLQMDISKIHVHMDVNTQTDPEHWKTVASMTTFMVGNAVLEAADDVIRQLQNLAGIVLRCPPERMVVAGDKVYLKDDPSMAIKIKDLALGHKEQKGNAIGGQVIGRGRFIMRHLTHLDPATGKGRAGPGWTVGAQGVEVELDTRELTYRILKAYTVLDAGKVINPRSARGLVMGGMSMGLGYGSRECVLYGEPGDIMNPQFRTYKVMRVGEQPEYVVDFIETPWLEAPYGARGLGEHPIIGMPAALANALASAAQADLTELPVTPEAIWRAKGGPQA